MTPPILPVDELIELHTPTDGITQVGLVEIDRYLRENNIWPGVYFEGNETFEWCWLTKRGTLPKRLRAALLKANHKVPDSLVETVGNIAARHSNKKTTHYFDFTQDFDWKRGDFGDGDSCFWTCRNSARTDVLPALGAYAVRFFSPGNNTWQRCYYPEMHGTTRAWLVPQTSDGEDFFVLFNVYSDRSEYTGYDIARVLGMYFGLSYKKIELYNNEVSDGLLYINSGYGYVVGNIDISSWDFNYHCSYSECYCEECECELEEDELFHGPGGEHYCGDCWNRYCFTCGSCYETCWENGSIYVESLNASVCSYCAESYDMCSWCEEYVHETDFDPEGEICGYCSRHTFVCECCEQRYNNKDSVDDNRCVNCPEEEDE